MDRASASGAPEIFEQLQKSTCGQSDSYAPTIIEASQIRSLLVKEIRMRSLFQFLFGQKTDDSQTGNITVAYSRDRGDHANQPILQALYRILRRDTPNKLTRPVDLPRLHDGTVSLFRLLSASPGTSHETRECDVCHTPFYIVNATLSFHITPSRYTLDIGGYCANCHTNRCHYHSRLVEVPSDIYDTNDWKPACSECGRPY